jgi:hypothetical protein
MAIQGRRFLIAMVVACVRTDIGNTQTNYFHQSVTAAFAGGVKAGPNGGVSYPFLNDAIGFSVGYLARPRRWLALDAGFDQIVRLVGSDVYQKYSTNANDELYLVPFGARYVWEPRSTRLRLTIGGGGAYLNHTVGNQAGGVVGFSGWGGQFVASGDCALTRSGRLRLGAMARYYFAAPRPSENFEAPNNSLTDTLHIFVLGPSVAFSFR